MGKMFDFSETEAVKFELLPEGTYNAKVYDYELKTSSNGNEMINFEFQITDEKFKTKKAWYLQVVEGKSKPYWLGLLETLSGLTKEEIAKQFKEPKDLEKLIGKKCRLRIKHEIYEGNKKQRVKKVLPGKVEEDLDDFGL